MQTSDDFVEYILESLSPLGKISASRMFGGVLLKVEGRQLGIIKFSKKNLKLKVQNNLSTLRKPTLNPLLSKIGGRLPTELWMTAP